MADPAHHKYAEEVFRPHAGDRLKIAYLLD